MADALYIRRIWSFSMALDLALIDEEVEKGFKMTIGQRHGERVGYISLRIAKVLGLSRWEQLQVLVAGLLHDIGTVGGFSQFHGDPRMVREHCFLGAKIIRRFPEGELLSEVLKYHHDTPNPKAFSIREEGEDIPLMSKIISLADKVDVYVGRKKMGRLEREAVINWVKANKDKTFYSEVVPSFLEIANYESFWLDLERGDLLEITLEMLFDSDEEIPDDQNLEHEYLNNLAYTFADLIDQKSSFTSRHSKTVSDIAVRLAEGLGWKDQSLREMRIASLLHDLGKLAVPNKILDKPGKLDPDEYAVIKTHTYYTYRLLSRAGFPRHIVRWAAYHHERLDGKGYPFGIKAEDIDIGARLMTIADIYTALTEDRPYRKPLPHEKAMEIISKGVGTQVDEELVNYAWRLLA